MKRDTLDSTTIDLDKSFAKPTETALVVEEQNYIDFGRILNEVSYKLPKGYPTIVDGVLTEREEVIIINEALEAEGLSTLPLPIQEVVNQEEVIHNAILKSDTFKTMLLPSLGVQPFKEPTAKGKNSVWRIELAGPAGRDASRVEAVTRLAKELSTKFGAATIKVATSKKAFSVTVQGHKSIYALKPSKKESSTDTNVKEGLSVIISYYPEFLPNIVKENVQQVCKSLLKFIRSKDSSVAGLSDNTIKSCVDYLNKVLQTKDIKVLKEMAVTMNQNSSHSKTFDQFFQNNKDFYIDRDQLFDQIRKAGSKVT